MAQNKSADTSFRDLVARLNAMNNMTPEQERAKMCAKIKYDMGYFNSQEYLTARNLFGPDAESGPMLRLEPMATSKEYAKCFPEPRQAVNPATGKTLEEDLY